jgi:5-methylcytosine-specific restriction enzyme subunit McrC
MSSAGSGSVKRPWKASERMAVLQLEEHRLCSLPSSALTVQQGERIYRLYGKYVDVHFPSPRTGGNWHLIPAGWVGMLAVDDGLSIAIQPKVPIGNLARLLATAYELEIEEFEGLVSCTAIGDLFQQLVHSLVRRVRRLLKTGLHHRYVVAKADTAAVRGRLDVRRTLDQLPSGRVACVFTERTADILENRVLLWTCHQLLRSGLCVASLQQQVRDVYRQLVGRMLLEPSTGSEWARMQYDRLSERYRAAHVLCRLLLEATSPTAVAGGARSIPFLIAMPALFEQFVARWLADALPPGYRLQVQERARVGTTSGVDFFLDLVIYDEQGRAACVLDTKYKDVANPPAQDIAQVGYYALLKHAPLAGLVLPTPAAGGNWSGAAGHVHTFRACFDIGADISRSGPIFVRDVLSRITAIDWQDRGAA